MPEKPPSTRPPRPSPQPPPPSKPRRLRMGSRPGEPAYAELLSASNFSFLRGASHPEELAATACGARPRRLCHRRPQHARRHRARPSRGQDRPASRYAVGCRLAFRDGTPDIAVWPTDRAAYGRLCRLLTAGNLRATKGECHLDLADLLEWGKGLEMAVLPGAPPSPQAGRDRRTRRRCRVERTLATLGAEAFPGSCRGFGATCLYRGD